MALHEWIGFILLAVSLLLVVGYRIKLRRERDRPTLHHTLFASHLGHRLMFSGGGDAVPSRLVRH